MFRHSDKERKMKYIKEMGLLVFLLTFIATVSVWTSAKANCTGCGEEGHEQCLPGDDHNHVTIQEHDKNSESSDCDVGDSVEAGVVDS